MVINLEPILNLEIIGLGTVWTHVKINLKFNKVK